MHKERESAATPDNEVSRLEHLWKAGSTDEYYLEAAKLANGILSDPAMPHKNEVAAQLLESLLSKTESPLKATNDDLFAMHKVARYLLSSGDGFGKDRRANARLLCRFLGEIRKEIVPNYIDKPVFENVAPPLATPRAAAGMDPEAIADPVLRAQYKEDIRRNRQNALMNTRQFVLRYMDLAMGPRITAYLAAAFRGEETQSPFLDDLIRCARLSDEEKTDLIRQTRKAGK